MDEVPDLRAVRLGAIPHKRRQRRILVPIRARKCAKTKLLRAMDVFESLAGVIDSILFRLPGLRAGGNVIAYLIGGGAIFLALIGAVIYAVVRNQDRGLMVVDGKPIAWHRGSIPIAIYVHQGVAAEWMQTLFAVVGEFGVFMRPERTWDGLRVDPAPRGSIMFEQAPVQNPSTHLRHPDGEIISANTMFPPAERFAADQRNKIVLHELGHALGLDHDDSTSSIMHPQLSDCAQALTESDRELLRRLYG
ncbi:MAG: matrixin family metalloprotease [bacterium]|nr:matrixin family metalloprotease [bacterium]